MKKVIALIAHDGKKTLLREFVKAYGKELQQFTLIGTGNSGKIAEEEGLKIERLLSGPLGGDAQIAALVATGQCHGVVFLRDPLGMHPHDPDISMLMRICDVHDVPLATNPTGAKLMLKGYALI
jgi:methylglyoxal synthase